MLASSTLPKLLFYCATIGAIVARPLLRDTAKKQTRNAEWEDVQPLVISDLDDSQENIFYSSRQQPETQYWPKGQIPYVFDKGFDDKEHRKNAKRAMQMWSEKTCVTFRRLSKDEVGSLTDYVIFKYGTVSNSYIGLRPHENKYIGQELNIKREQAHEMRIYLHEIGHVIGFNHEHSRPNRDRYITIDESNIQPAGRHNFNIVDNYKKDTNYDYSSIMHYEVKAYAVEETKPTIRVLNPDDENIKISKIGKIAELSNSDIEWANKIYCKTVAPPITTPEPPKYYKNYKIELAYNPLTTTSPDGYGGTHGKKFLNCNNESCVLEAKRNSNPFNLVITTVYSNSSELRVGDQVLLSTHKWGVKRGEWITCEDSGCSSNQMCYNATYDASNGDVNFAFNKSGCLDQILTVTAVGKEMNDLIEEEDIIRLEYRKHGQTVRWFGCDSGDCRRKQCTESRRDNSRTNNTNPLKQKDSESCLQSIDQFEFWKL